MAGAHAALTLPELRLFVRAAESISVDITAEGTEWTSTLLHLMAEQDDSPSIACTIIHAPVAVAQARNGDWFVDGGYWVRAVDPPNGWVVGPPLFSRATGLALQTVSALDGDGRTSLARTSGYAYFGAPSRDRSYFVVGRQRERLKGHIMDLDGTLAPDTCHRAVGLRRWLTGGDTLAPVSCAGADRHEKC